MAVFAVGSIDLSMRDNAGNLLPANIYTLEGIQTSDGELRKLSIGQLVMAICLSRATELEQKIVGKMESLAETTAYLEALTSLDAEFVAFTSDGVYRDYALKTSVVVDGKTYTMAAEALSALGVTGITDGASTNAEVVAAIESRMDALNSLSQTTLIDIQSLTSKRNDTYNLVSNVLKSLNTVLIGNVNNL